MKKLLLILPFVFSCFTPTTESGRVVGKLVKDANCKIINSTQSFTVECNQTAHIILYETSGGCDGIASECAVSKDRFDSTDVGDMFTCNYISPEAP